MAAALLVRAFASGDVGDEDAAQAALSAAVAMEGGAATVFAACCEQGHVAVARWLCEHMGIGVGGVCAPGVDVHADNDAAFRKACWNGHLAVARWLHEDVGGVKVHA